MSEKKKVIYVKDLVIKADNVTVEPAQSRHQVDPFFGPRRIESEEVEEKVDDEVLGDEDDKENDKEDGGRRPFSWI
ncbi:hypothetical protein [Sediminibacillus albus]|uniref:Uncharacterized protein n=1 Tax=Sediminibacillus albus TaxID=407036 RepID=A0A1G8X849_9BACI|nr:hypothetical protein [Sediminibacillus albus]SDJ86584.1 hypothetical protein SAMN05216243_1212 [Sediminibacillus albus]